MKKKVLRTILVVLILIISIVSSYFITMFVDKANNKGKEAIIDVVFDDNEYYVMPNSEVLDKETALLEWPYKFSVSNKGNTAGIYQIIILDDKDNDLKRDDLSYILFLDDKEIATGNLIDLKNDILYEGNIKKNSEQKYKLYIYKTKETEGKNYKYSIKLNAILEGGPGF